MDTAWPQPPLHRQARGSGLGQTPAHILSALPQLSHYEQNSTPGSPRWERPEPPRGPAMLRAGTSGAPGTCSRSRWSHPVSPSTHAVVTEQPLVRPHSQASVPAARSVPGTRGCTGHRRQAAATDTPVSTPAVRQLPWDVLRAAASPGPGSPPFPAGPGVSHSGPCVLHPRAPRTSRGTSAGQHGHRQ